jgi:hypothetical protein
MVKYENQDKKTRAAFNEHIPKINQNRRQGGLFKIGNHRNRQNL